MPRDLSADEFEAAMMMLHAHRDPDGLKFSEADRGPQTTIDLLTGRSVTTQWVDGQLMVKRDAY